MLKIPFRVISWTIAWPTFLVICGIFYFYGIFALKDLFVALVSLVVSTIIIFILRIFVNKEKQDRRRFEKTFIERFGKKHRGKALEFFEKLEKRHFISGHISRATILAFLVMAKVSFRTDYLLMLAIYVVIIGISRLILKKHNLLDLILGLILGMLSVYFVNILIF